MIRASFYCIHSKHKDGTEYADILATATSQSDAEALGRRKLAGGSYDDGSLPEFVKAERITTGQARRLWGSNPIDWMYHDEMRYLIDA